MNVMKLKIKLIRNFYILTKRNRYILYNWQHYNRDGAHHDHSRHHTKRQNDQTRHQNDHVKHHTRHQNDDIRHHNAHNKHNTNHQNDHNTHQKS